MSRKNFMLSWVEHEIIFIASRSVCPFPVWQHNFVSPSAFSRRAVVSYWQKCVHEVLVNRLGGLSLPRKSVVRLTDRSDMTLDVYHGRKTTIQQQQQLFALSQLILWYTVRFNSLTTKSRWQNFVCKFSLRIQRLEDKHCRSALSLALKELTDLGKSRGG